MYIEGNKKKLYIVLIALAVYQNLKQDFDAEFFDESSVAWNQNKKKLGNGMYAYRTRSTTRK